MDIFFLSVASVSTCVLLIVALKYLSVFRWISGNAYVLSHEKDHFSILEVLDLFKNVRPFPISNAKGWKIDSYGHGHRIWFNFLTFPHNINAPSIKVFAVFDRVGSSCQALLAVLKDISQSCDWKPGVISTSHSHSVKSHRVPSSGRGLPSMPVQVDCIKEERLVFSEPKFFFQSYDPWVNPNVIPTVSVEFKRFWHREDNGVCWLLQMNEKLQTSEFYLIQPVTDVEQCLLTIVTWSMVTTQSSKEKASILLSSLGDYMCVRRLQKTPLLSITLPQDLSDTYEDSSDSSQDKGTYSKNRKTLYNNSAKKLNIDKKSENNNIEASPKKQRRTDYEKYLSILRYKSKGSLTNPKGPNSSATLPANFKPQDVEVLEDKRSHFQRSISDGAALKQSRLLDQQLDQLDGAQGDGEEDTDEEREGEESHDSSHLAQSNVSEEDLQVAHYKTLSNQSAAELLAVAMRASNIDLELTSDKQAEASGGWLFSSFEKNIVVLKKVTTPGSTVQSYIGKGFVLAPPKIVWDAVKNPRTRFTHDDTLKKVDIVENIEGSLKIVYFYHESQQFLAKSYCDMCVLQGERQEGDKYVLNYISIDHEKCPSQPGTLRAKYLPSGWVIEPAQQDNRVYSIVTYVMQVDFGSLQDGSEKLPFEDMMSRHPLSIVDLQQYLKPACGFQRRKSLT